MSRCPVLFASIVLSLPAVFYGQPPCSPSFLVVAIRNPAEGSSLLVGRPSTILAAVRDNCGQIVTGLQVTATFSDGSRDLTLNDAGEGNWMASWQPAAPGILTVIVVAFKQGSPNPLVGRATAHIQVLSDTISVLPPPTLLDAATLTPINTLAPGEIIAIVGSGLADSTVTSGPLPWPVELGSAMVFLNGRALPLLYASDTQINAMVPYGITPNAQYQLLAVRRTSANSAVPVLAVPAQPGIFTVDGTGRGQGLIVNSATNLVSDALSPTKHGDVVVIYCAGLGEVTPPVQAGTEAPDSPPASTAQPVTVSIGGVPAQVLFAGLTPTLSGLYQVNTVVPEGAARGDQVAVRITISGMTSPPVTMALQ